MALGKCRVLIVEDDPDARLALQNMLQLLGHEVRCAETAAGAIRELRSQRAFDAVILDLVLPDENGMVVLSDVRERKLATRVAVVTALCTTEGDLKLPAEMRPDAFFRKPIDAYAIAGWVAECVPRPNSRPQQNHAG